MVECGEVWCGVVCYGVVGCDVERGMVWDSGTWCSVVHFEAKLFVCVGPD